MWSGLVTMETRVFTLFKYLLLCLIINPCWPHSFQNQLHWVNLLSCLFAFSVVGGWGGYVDCHILLLLSTATLTHTLWILFSSARLSTSCTLTQTWSGRPWPRSGWTRRRRLRRHGASAGRCSALTRSVVAGLAC